MTPSPPFPEVGEEREKATGSQVPASGPPFPTWDCCRRMYECGRDIGRQCELGWGRERCLKYGHLWGLQYLDGETGRNKWELLRPSKAIKDVETEALSCT